MLDLYRSDSDSEVRFECAVVLGRAGLAGAARALASGVQHDINPRVASSSLVALGRLLDKHPDDAAVRASAKEAAKYWVRCGRFSSYIDALGILRSLKDRACIPDLERLVPRVRPASQTRIVDVIHDIGGPEASAALRRIRSGAGNSELRAHVGQLLGQ